MNVQSLKHVILENEDACFVFATHIAKYLQIGDILFLDGILGSGKTTFVKGIVKSLNGDVTQVHSPTYTLMHHYEADMPVIHIDAYRLQQRNGLEGLGFYEMKDLSVSCIEWAANVDIDSSDEQIWKIRFEHVDMDKRSVQVQSPLNRQIVWN